ncbi:MAG: hypothetical protein IBX68_03715 [Dehalococcoidia bacterium]|nr:hypothetical protein [Dehalococcoidia bacterium]
MEIRFSRHARNKVRLYKLTSDEVEDVIQLGEQLNQGSKLESRLGDLRVIWLMVAECALVVTVIRTRRR